MLTETMRQLIRTFVRQQADGPHGQRIYFRALVGPTKARGRGALPGVYVRDHDEDTLETAVFEHVAASRAKLSRSGDVFWLHAYIRGEVNPVDGVCLDFRPGQAPAKPPGTRSGLLVFGDPTTGPMLVWFLEEVTC